MVRVARLKSERPLLVTTQWYPSGEWADIVRSAGEGLKRWRDLRHPVVFADFGDLGEGISGVRLARVLRGKSPDVRIYLLCDAVDAGQQVWAQANGANEVIRRKPQLIARRLSPLHGQP